MNLSRLFLMISISLSLNSYADCFTEAGQRQQISPHYLRAIVRVESNYNPLAENKKSHALGMMQILPWHFPYLEEKYHIKKDALLDPCTNIHVGAFILRGFINQYGNTWRAIGAYGVGNAKTKEAEQQRQKYAEKVYAALKKQSLARPAQENPINVADSNAETGSQSESNKMQTVVVE